MVSESLQPPRGAVHDALSRRVVVNASRIFWLYGDRESDGTPQLTGNRSYTSQQA